MKERDTDIRFVWEGPGYCYNFSGWVWLDQVGYFLKTERRDRRCNDV